jgi:hypothetical protein
MSIDIRNSNRAQYYYDQFLKSHEQDPISSIYKAKLDDVRQLESDLGTSASVADVPPGGNFSRIFIYNCERRLLSPKTYTFSFDCAYVEEAAPKEQKHVGSSITAIISPAPLVLNVLAVISAILGAALKIALDTQAKIANSVAVPAAGVAKLQPKDLFGQLTTDLVTVNTCEAVVAAMITALFFYNVYDSTDVGRKLNVGVGWRSALIIGGLSGLLNERIIAALHGLLG